MKNDEIQIEILEDGTVKVSTDEIGAANHLNAEQFLTFLSRQLGGETTTTRKRDAHTHNHGHQHSHA